MADPLTMEGIPRTARSTSNHSSQQIKKVCDHNHLTDEYWIPVDNTSNLNDHFQTIFSLISKSFTLGKLIFNSASRCWTFLTSHWIISDIKQKMAWKGSFRLRVLSTGPQYLSVKWLWLQTFFICWLEWSDADRAVRIPSTAIGSAIS